MPDMRQSDEEARSFVDPRTTQHDPARIRVFFSMLLHSAAIANAARECTGGRIRKSGHYRTSAMDGRRLAQEDKG